MTEIYLPIEIEDFEYNLDKFIERYLDLKNENTALQPKDGRREAPTPPRKNILKNFGKGVDERKSWEYNFLHA